MVAAAIRPLDREHIIQHYESFVEYSLDGSIPIQAFGSTFKTMCNVDSQQLMISQVLECDYHAAEAAEVMRAFTNVGEILTFMEAFDPDAYLTATPTCEDLCLDLGILQRWVADLRSMRPTMQQGLLLFDLSSLRADILEIGETTIKAFIKLANEWLYDNCIRVRVSPRYLWIFLDIRCSVCCTCTPSATWAQVSRLSNQIPDSCWCRPLQPVHWTALAKVPRLKI